MLRSSGRAAINVSADVDESKDLQSIVNVLEDGPLLDLAARHGVSYSFEGRRKDEQRTIQDMKIGLMLALLMIYIILTWVFSSWSIPLVIMLTIPLGLVGSIFGHWLMGYDMTILSFFGVFALAGIIVNDSIVLVRSFQSLREEKPDGEIDQAIIDTACARLRAVLMTSLTTIGGLMPLMFETSRQAQFLIPMAISICFGLAFATFLILLFTPACLSYHQSAKARLAGIFGGSQVTAEADAKH